MTAMPGSNASGPPEPVGGRTVGDLLLDADIAARELLWDAPPETAKAKARSWGEVVDEKGVYPVRIIESVDHGRRGATDGRLPAPCCPYPASPACLPLSQHPPASRTEPRCSLRPTCRWSPSRASLAWSCAVRFLAPRRWRASLVSRSRRSRTGSGPGKSRASGSGSTPSSRQDTSAKSSSQVSDVPQLPGCRQRSAAPRGRSFRAQPVSGLGADTRRPRRGAAAFR